MTRTVRAFEQAVVELASERPVSQITVAELADRAGVSRATFYNRYSTPLDPLIQVLYDDLERGRRRDDELCAEGGYSAPELFRLAAAGIADHAERFIGVYRNSLADPADSGVYEAFVRHCGAYALAFLARTEQHGPPGAGRQMIAQFMAHGFAGAVRAWLDNPSVTKDELVASAMACAPAWWRSGPVPDPASQ
ncbi:TetR/AcrR family transcriptional regulator [Streptomyces sp. NPDC058683]|uniref:TetR/AcrR family transcriptional regulator n=1 Tax=Streptomyces sp. NPDC058683 TaxID=3346597 RepID=UPI003664FCED